MEDDDFAVRDRRSRKAGAELEAPEDFGAVRGEGWSDSGVAGISDSVAGGAEELGPVGGGGEAGKEEDEAEDGLHEKPMEMMWRDSIEQSNAGCIFTMRRWTNFARITR